MLTVRLRLLTFRYQVSTISESNLYALRFEMIYDFHFEMREQNFRTQNYFRQENPEYFIDENTL